MLLQPKFLSKEERAKIAIAKRAAEIKEERGREEKQRAEREKLEKQAQDLRSTEHAPPVSHSYRRGQLFTQIISNDQVAIDNRQDARYTGTKGLPTGPRAQLGSNVPTGPRADRVKSANPASNSPTPLAPTNMAPPPPPPPPTESTGETSFVPHMTDTDLTAIRSRYLGVQTKKRKIRKMNDRKFVFDWDEQEDTFSSESPSAVGASRQGALVMFGRGHLAGMDEDSRQIPGAGNGDANMKAIDSMERRKTAKAGFDERHWSEKPLDEMRERDWRIFREDFSISTKGNYNPIFLNS